MKYSVLISNDENKEVCNFIKKGLMHRCFSMNFAKFLKTLFYRILPVAASAYELTPKF